MVEPQPPSNQRYEAKFGLAQGAARRQVRHLLGRRIEWLERAVEVAVRAADYPTACLRRKAVNQVRELQEAIADSSEPYTWHMPLTPEEVAAIERGPRA
ncbi:hypothetical protein LCGC14_1308880 [marine sediment metagenome]|uniref:Uncharacterized protein n=1 Tax=marine sediment metagenome TaxID=412755 RepID=A0A0F9KMZ4_9ZZZZ